MKAGVPWSSSERDFGGLWHKGLAIGNAVPVAAVAADGELDVPGTERVVVVFGIEAEDGEEAD